VSDPSVIPGGFNAIIFTVEHIVTTIHLQNGVTYFNLFHDGKI